MCRGVDRHARHGDARESWRTGQPEVALVPPIWIGICPRPSVWIHRGLAAAEAVDTKMQMRPGRGPCAARNPDHLSARDVLAFGHIDLKEMAVERFEAVAVVDLHRLAAQAL